MIARRSISMLVGLLLLGAWAARAQTVPDTVSYQGRLTDSSGQPVADGSYDVQFRMYTASSGGSAFWTSDTMTVQTAGGMFSTVMQHLPPSTIAGKTDVWIETLAAPHGSTLAALSPRVKLASVPFALRAADVSLPFAGSVSSSSTAVSVTNSGTGSAGNFQITNAGSSSPALTAVTSGAGAALRATGTNAASLQGNATVDGTLGVGTASPRGKLEVQAASGNSYAYISRTAPAQGAVGLTLAGGTGGADWQVYQPSGSNDLRFYDTADRLAIKSGNVGIGTITPGYPLDVNGIVRSATGGFKFPDGSTQTVAGVTGSGTDNYLARWNGTGAVQAGAVYQTDAGNIGIGTMTPASPLDVVGTVGMTGFKLGTTPTNGYVLTSDASGVGTWKAVVVPDGSVTSAKITDGTIVNADVSPTAAIADTKLAGTGTMVANLNAAMVGGFTATQLLAPVKQVIRGVITFSGSNYQVAQTFSPSINPAKAVVNLSQAVLSPGSGNYTFRSGACLVSLSATSITVAVDYDPLSNLNPVRVSYEIVEYN